jgi:hypothetical protein
MPTFLATQDAEIRRIVVHGYPRKKRDPILTNKLGRMMHSYIPSCWGGGGSRLAVQGQPG